MPLMTNAEAFRYDFGIYATELWAMTETQLLDWLTAPCGRERPKDIVVHGEWIAEPNCMFRCSNCSAHYPSVKGYMDFPYCPFCGADMRERKE